MFLRQYAEIRAKYGARSSQAQRAAHVITNCGPSVTDCDARVCLESIREGGRLWLKQTRQLKPYKAPPEPGR